MLHTLKKEWEDFYNGSKAENTIWKATDPVIQKKKENYYLKLCLFEDETETSVYFEQNNKSTMLLIEDTMFSKCSSTKNGGAIMFSTDGKYAQNRVCSYKSKVPQHEYGVFCFLIAYYNEIKLYDSSVSFSGGKLNEGYCTINICGNVKFSSINVSDSKIRQHCIFHIMEISNESEISYSTFARNAQYKYNTYYMSMIHALDEIPFKIRTSNFLENSGSNGPVLDLNDLETTISNCTFHGNTAKYKFGVYDGKCTVISCFITDSMPDSNFPIYISTMKSRYTHLLPYFMTNECFAERPLKYSIVQHKEITDFVDNSIYPSLIISQFDFFLSWF